MLFDRYELRYLPLFHEELKERVLYIADNLVTSDTINQMIRRVRKQLEDEDGIHIGHFTSHAFRDTFATDYIHAHKDQGGDMKALQEILGHGTYAMTTDLYAHTLDEDLIAGMMRMDDYA